MESNALEISTNSSVVSMIKQIVRIDEIMERSLQKLFYFFLRIFLKALTNLSKKALMAK